MPLKKSLSLPLITFYGLGTILGAGIYVLVGKVAASAGPFTHLSFLLAALVAGLSAYSFAQLSKKFPVSAGEVHYIEQGLQASRLASLAGYGLLLTGTVSSAAIVRGFVGYLEVFVHLPEPLAIFIVVAVIALLAALGIAESVKFASLITLIEVGGLLFIIYLCRNDIAHQFTQVVTQWPTSSQEFSTLFTGAFLAFYAYIGFEDMVNVAEEVKDVKKNLPRAILLALVISTVIYLFVALAALSAMNLDELAKSKAPIADIFLSRTNGSPQSIALISMLAVINGALIQIIMSSRVLYGMGKKNKIPQWFACVNNKTGTPIRATLFMAMLILVFSLFLPIETLAKITSAITLSIFTLVNLSLLRLNLRTNLRGSALLVPATATLLTLVLLLSELF